MSALPNDIQENARRIRAIVEPIASSCHDKPVFLVDGDRTLTAEDTSRTFLKLAGLDPMEIKRRFQREGYVFSAFRFHAQRHVDLGEEVFAQLAPQVAEQCEPHPGALEFLRLASTRAQVFIVTAGIPRIWEALLAQQGVDGVGVIGGIDPRAPYVFGRGEKEQVARLFLQHASLIVGVGDSDVDTRLLQLSHHAVVVVNHRQNEDLMPHLEGHPSLWQVVAQGQAHPGIPALDFSMLPSLLDRPVPSHSR